MWMSNFDQQIIFMSNIMNKNIKSTIKHSNKIKLLGLKRIQHDIIINIVGMKLDFKLSISKY